MNNGLQLNILAVNVTQALTEKKGKARPGIHFGIPDPTPVSDNLGAIPAFKPNVNFTADPVPARSA